MRKNHVLARRVITVGIGKGDQCDDAALVDEQRMARQRLRGLDRNDEAGVEADVDVDHRSRLEGCIMTPRDCASGASRKTKKSPASGGALFGASRVTS
jgi:hypothetical protein